MSPTDEFFHIARSPRANTQQPKRSNPEESTITNPVTPTQPPTLISSDSDSTCATTLQVSKPSLFERRRGRPLSLSPLSGHKRTTCCESSDGERRGDPSDSSQEAPQRRRTRQRSSPPEPCPTPSLNDQQVLLEEEMDVFSILSPISEDDFVLAAQLNSTEDSSEVEELNEQSGEAWESRLVGDHPLLPTPCPVAPPLTLSRFTASMLSPQPQQSPVADSEVREALKLMQPSTCRKTHSFFVLSPYKDQRGAMEETFLNADKPLSTPPLCRSSLPFTPGFEFASFEEL